MEPTTRQPNSGQGDWPINHVLSPIFETLAKGEPVDESMARQLGGTCEKPYALVMMRPLQQQRVQINPSDVFELLKHASIRATAIGHDGIIVVLSSYADARRVIDVVCDKNKASRWQTAFSLPFANIGSIDQQFKLVTFTLDNSGNKGPADAKDSALAFLKNEITTKVRVEHLLHPALDKLARYDQANQSNLLDTLRVYLEHDRNAQRCANMLYLHRNSLQYRVRRIQEIADVNLDDPAERTYLRLSFLLSD